MDFHSLSRKELQALCKQNKIPANMTNVAMADALQALPTVEGLDDFMNKLQSDPSQSPGKPATGSPDAPRTAAGTSTRRKPTKEEPHSSQTMNRSRRTTKRAITEEVEQENKRDNVLDTPAMPTSRRRAPAASSRRKQAEIQEESVQRAYSTRRSVRLLEKSMAELTLKKKGAMEPIKMDELDKLMATKEEKKDASEADLQTFSKEHSEQTRDSKLLPGTNLSESLKNEKDFENDIQEIKISDNLGDLPVLEAQEETHDEKTNETDVILGSNDVATTEHSSKHDCLNEEPMNEEDGKANGSTVSGDISSEAPDHVPADPSILTSFVNPAEAAMEDDPIVTCESDEQVLDEAEENQDGQEPVVPESDIGLDQFVAESNSIHEDENFHSDLGSEKSMISPVPSSEESNNLIDSFGEKERQDTEALVDADDSDSASKDGLAQMENSDKSEKQTSTLPLICENKSDLGSEKSMISPVPSSEESNNLIDTFGEKERQDTEALAESSASKDGLAQMENSDKSEKQTSPLPLICENKSEGDNALAKMQDNADAKFLVDHIVLAKMQDNADAKSLVDHIVMPAEEFPVATKGSSPLLDKTLTSPKRTSPAPLVSGGEANSGLPVSSFAADSLSGQFPRPTLPTPKSSSKKEKTIQKLSYVADNKENFDLSERIGEPKNDQVKKKKKNTIDEDSLKDISLRQLTRMVKELQITNNKKNSEDKGTTKLQVGNSRLALQKLSENHLPSAQPEKGN